MNGVSHMLPFVVGGGILIALAFLIGGMIAASGKSGFLGALVAGFVAGLLMNALKKLFSKLPDAIEKNAPVFGVLLIGLINKAAYVCSSFSSWYSS